MIRQCTIIFACLALGELIVTLIPVKMPSSIIGMILLTVFLKAGWIKIAWVKGIADFLSGNIAFFFIPSGVSIMLYLDILQQSWMPVIVAALVSTMLTLTVTGWVHQIARKKLTSPHSHHHHSHRTHHKKKA